jgi:TatA/E family protein of Tat protein translocase
LFSFGGSEFLIIAVLVLLLFGPDKIPQLARTIGRYTREFRKYRDIMESTLRGEMGEDEPKSEWQSDYEYRLAKERAKAERGEDGDESADTGDGAESEPTGKADDTGGSEVVVPKSAEAGPAAPAAVSAPCADDAPVLSADEVAATSEDDEEEEA